MTKLTWLEPLKVTIEMIYREIPGTGYDRTAAGFIATLREDILDAADGDKILSITIEGPHGSRYRVENPE